MKIRLVGHQQEPIMPIGDSGPWFDFKKELESFPNEIVNLGFGQAIDALVANSHTLEGNIECKLAKVPLKRKILILWEPIVVKPKNYSKKVLKEYGKIFAPSLEWADKLQAESFNWPQLDLRDIDPNFDNWKGRSNKAVMLLANKFSACKGEQYSLRRSISIQSEKRKLLDLYGSAWNSGKMYDFRHYLGNVLRTPLNKLKYKSWVGLFHTHKNYKGPSFNKLQTLSQYRISLVIENSTDYVSEKLFDSIASGAITIYVGPNVEDYGIDKESVIHCEPKKEAIIDQIEFLMSLSLEKQVEMARNQFQLLCKNSLQSEGHFVLRNLAARINNYLKSTQSSQK